MNTFFRNLLSLNLLCITLFFTACSKDDDGTNNIDNLATGPIELPVLRQGVNDLFISGDELEYMLRTMLEGKYE